MTKDQTLEILRAMAEEFSAAATGLDPGNTGGIELARIGQAYQRAADLVTQIEPETIKRRRRSRRPAEGEEDGNRRRGRPRRKVEAS